MNNPPAFPRSSGPFIPGEQGVTHEGQEGMTLRDYFAAKAMAAQIANPYTGKQYHDGGLPKEDQLASVVRNAYEMADAMLAEREKTQ